MTCPTKNKNIGRETAKAIVDLSIADDRLSCDFILFFIIWISKAPIPSPKNATEIAIKA